MNNFKKIAADAAEKYSQIDEVNFADVVARQKEKYGGKLPDKYPAAKKTASNLDVGTSKAAKVYSGKPQHKDIFGHDTKSQASGATGPRASIMQHAANKIKKVFSKEEVEQMDEISKELAGKYLTAPQGKGANKYKVSMDKSVYPNYDALSKHDKSVGRALKRSGGSALNKKPSYYKEEDEAIEEMSDSQMKTREHNVKSMKKNFGDFRKRYGDKAKSVMYATATKQAMKEDEDQDTEDMHYCAKHVYSDLFGEGFVLEGQHAEPNDEGEIDWYMVEFDDGIRKIPTHKLEIMVAEYHMNHKKKKKMMEEEEELDEMSSKMKMKLGLYGKKKKMMEEDEVAEAHDGNLANNAPPYDKVTHGDVITGRLGKDHQGGKSKHARERSKYQGKGVPMGPAEMLSKLKGMK